MPSSPAERQKTIEAERQLGRLRLAGIVGSVAAYAVFWPGQGIPWLAWTVAGIAAAYTGALRGLKLHRRWPVLLSSHGSIATDTVLLGLWVFATGGYDSPFYLLWFVSIAGAAFRSSARATLGAAGAYAAAYGTLLALTGAAAAHPGESLVRVMVLLLLGGVCALLARWSSAQAEARAGMRQLAEAGSLAGELDLERALARIVAAGEGLLGAQRGALYLLERKGDGNGGEERLVCPHAHGLSRAYVDAVAAVYRELPGARLLGGAPFVHVEDARSEPAMAVLREHVEREGFRTYAAFPMQLNGTLIGALTLYRDEVRPFSEAELEAGRTLAGQAAIAIENARLVRELRANEERYRTILTEVEDGYFEVDLKGRFTFVNEALARVVGRAKEDLLGRSYRDFTDEHSARVLFDGFNQVYRTGKPIQGLECEALRPDGTRVPVETSVSLVRRNGDEPVGFRGVARDVGARKRAEAERASSRERQRELERLRELDRFKTRFVNTAAHELNTPLTPIKMQLYLLRSSRGAGLSEEQQRSVRILERNIDRLADLVQDVVEAARLQAGRLGIRREPVDLSKLALEAVESFQQPAEAQEVRLEMRTVPGLVLEADGRRLTQVLFNFLSNALKFTPGGGHVVVETAREGEELAVRVRDTGAGLRPEDIPKLFQPFSQVHDTVRGAQPGTGLGLYISRGIVELHGGRIWAESEGLGQGSTFGFRLPARTPAAAAAAVRTPAPGAPVERALEPAPPP